MTIKVTTNGFQITEWHYYTNQNDSKNDYKWISNYEMALLY